MSGQYCENYDVKRETVHCYPRNADRCCASISACFSTFAFVLFCYITNQLMTGTLGYSEYCFPRISMFPTTSSSRETLRFSGTKLTVPLAGTCHRVLIIIWRCLTRTENYQIHEFDWLKSIL